MNIDPNYGGMRFIFKGNICPVSKNKNKKTKKKERKEIYILKWVWRSFDNEKIDLRKNILESNLYTIVWEKHEIRLNFICTCHFHAHSSFASY